MKYISNRSVRIVMKTFLCVYIFLMTRNISFNTIEMFFILFRILYWRKKMMTGFIIKSDSFHYSIHLMYIKMINYYKLSKNILSQMKSSDLLCDVSVLFIIFLLHLAKTFYIKIIFKCKQSA